MAPNLRAPRNPLLDHRRTDFLFTQNANSAMFMYTDMARFGEAPSLSDSTVIVTTEPYEARPRSNDDWEWKEVDGDMFVNAIGGETIRSADADNILLEGPSTFRNSCYSALGYLAGHLKEGRAQEEKGNRDWLDSSQKSVVLHWNIMALHRAAHKGCPLCKTLWTRCFDDDDWALAREARIELFWNSDAASSWDGSCPGETRLICVLFPGGDAPIHEATYLNIFRFQLWPYKKFSHYFEHDVVEDMQDLSLDTPAVQLETSSTGDCWHLGQKWLSDCEKNESGQHDTCNIISNNEQMWRPTRLLDLGEIEETGRIRLISTVEKDIKGSRTEHDKDEQDETEGGERPEYITLSHCWGAWGAKELQRLTKSNIDLWQSKGVEIASLPLTFRHAAEIASWFNVKWLWIDSMCIIQDSAEDWDHEAALMCEVYSNALLNVSADDSVDARGGCFKDRAPVSVQPFKLHMLNMKTAWWVTVDERSMFEWVEKAPISKRAWVYQERQLSRRVLHFTRHEVFWECCAKSPSLASESYPRGSPLRRDFVGQSKIEFPPVLGDTLALNVPLGKTWDAICEDFSTRNLSFVQDKLPALAGLAKELGIRCPSDTYLAGMWYSSLRQQLLWEMIWKVKVGDMDLDAEDDAPQQSTQSDPGYVVPSWSWLSVDAPISMKKMFSFHSLIDIISFDCQTCSTADPYGRISSASIQVCALVRRVTIVTKPSPFEGDVYDNYAALGVEKSIDVYVNDEGREALKIGNRVANAQQFFENEDRRDTVPDSRSYLCMLAAVTQYSEGSPRELKGLLLEPAERKDHFKRAGTITFKGGCALRMRYMIDEDLHADNGRSLQYDQLIAPIWGGVNFGGGKATKKVSVEGHGPMSLYDFDEGAENTWYQKLVPREITLV